MAVESVKKAGGAGTVSHQGTSDLWSIGLGESQ